MSRCDKLSVLLERRLSPSLFEIILQRYGLIGEKKTLFDISKSYGLTRERIRQLQKNGITRIRRMANIYCPHNVLLEEAKLSTKISEIHDVSSEFNEEGVIRLIVDVYGDMYEIVKSKYLVGEFIIRKGYEYDFEEKIQGIIELLSNLDGYSNILEVSNKYNIHQSVIFSIKTAVIKGDKIAMRSNKIFYKHSLVAVVESAIEHEMRHLPFSKIRNLCDLSRSQLLYVIQNSKRIVGIGKNNYALTDWNYLRGSVIDLAIHYLKEAGEPLTPRALLSLLTKQRLFTERSMSIAISRSPDIQRLTTGQYVLKEQGYEDIMDKHTRKSTYPVALKIAVLNAVKTTSYPISTKQILEIIVQNYGDKTSNKYSSVNVTLHILMRERKVELVKRNTNSYYQAIREYENT